MQMDRNREFGRPIFGAGGWAFMAVPPFVDLAGEWAFVGLPPPFYAAEATSLPYRTQSLVLGAEPW